MIFWKSLGLLAITLALGRPAQAAMDLPSNGIVHPTALSIRTPGAGDLMTDSSYLLWSNGQIGENIFFPASTTYTFSVVARGTPANLVWPNLQLLIDDRVIQNVAVGSGNFLAYRGPSIAISAGTHRISVAFTNDLRSGGEDRNLYLYQLGITAVPADTGQASFVSDWTRSSLGNWRWTQIMSANRLQPDLNVRTNHGLTPARVEVRPGDNPIGATGERSEVLMMKNATTDSLTENPNSGTQYFALSYFFPTTWSGTEIAGNPNSWSAVFQLHGPDDLSAPPSFALHVSDKFRISRLAGDLSTQRNVVYELSDGGAVRLGEWVDFVVKIQLDSREAGAITVWRRNQGSPSFAQVLNVTNVATLQYRGGSVGEHYWKQGLYRGAVPDRTDVLWMGPMARATSFLAAEKAAFGTQAGMP
jgi:hypothetical protein